MIYIETKKLPQTIRNALKEIEYGRKDISVEPSDTIRAVSPSGSGMRGFTAMVDLQSNKHKIFWGSWGGANIFNKDNAVDRDVAVRTMPLNAVVIQGHIGGGSPNHARILAHPGVLQGLLPSGDGGEIPTEVKAVCVIFKRLKSFARRDDYLRWARNDYSEVPRSLTVDNPMSWTSAVEKAIELGFVKMNKRGATQVTTAGRNVATQTLG